MERMSRRMMLAATGLAVLAGCDGTDPVGPSNGPSAPPVTSPSETVEHTDLLPDGFDTTIRWKNEKLWWCGGQVVEMFDHLWFVATEPFNQDNPNDFQREVFLAGINLKQPDKLIKSTRTWTQKWDQLTDLSVIDKDSGLLSLSVVGHGVFLVQVNATDAVVTKLPPHPWKGSVAVLTCPGMRVAVSEVPGQGHGWRTAVLDGQQWRTFTASHNEQLDSWDAERMWGENLAGVPVWVGNGEVKVGKYTHRLNPAGSLETVRVALLPAGVLVQQEKRPDALNTLYGWDGKVQPFAMHLVPQVRWWRASEWNCITPSGRFLYGGDGVVDQTSRFAMQTADRGTVIWVDEQDGKATAHVLNDGTGYMELLPVTGMDYPSPSQDHLRPFIGTQKGDKGETLGLFAGGIVAPDEASGGRFGLPVMICAKPA